MRSNTVWVCRCGEWFPVGKGDLLHFVKDPIYRKKYKCPKCSGVMEQKESSMDRETTQHIQEIRSKINSHFPVLRGSFTLEVNSRGVIILDVDLYGKFGYNDERLETLLGHHGYYFGNREYETRGDHQHLLIEIV